MNILIPHKWLLEHLETSANPETIQEKLSLSGPSVERIYEKGGEPVYDIEVTVNRVDSMSVRGIAREAAVILQQFGIDSKLKAPNYENESLSAELDKDEQLPPPVVKNDPNLCRRVMMIVLKNVKRTPTPDWMAKRLKQIDINIHDSVIDITNYITHEVGHPVHAFDYDKVMQTGGQIIIKEAEAGKKFTTLDGLEFETVGGEVVFESPDGTIIDLPSIKGTLNTSVNDDTKNILLLIDSIKPEKIRFASMTHQIRTTAAQLNEKSVDPHLAVPTIKLGIKLYKELCSAVVASQLHDEFPGDFENQEVRLPLERVSDYLGIEIPVEQIVQILETLDCEVKVDNVAKQVVIKPPTFRPDLKIPADIIEEIARIYGYHNLPSKIMETKIPLEKPTGVDFVIENRIKRYLAAIGWQEVYSFSIVSADQAEESGWATSEHLALQNPLSEDHIYLRRSLLPSLRPILEGNQDRGSLSVFELANVYHPVKNDLPKEELELGMYSKKPYREVRGDIESLLEQFFIEEIEVRSVNSDGDTHQVGEIFVKHAETFENLGLIKIDSSGQTNVEIRISQLLKVAKTHPSLQPLAKTAPIIEDLTFVLPEKTEVGRVISEIKNQDEIIKNVELLDIYQQNYSFRVVYQDQNENLSSETVKPIREKIVEAIAKSFDAKLVGEIN